MQRNQTAHFKPLSRRQMQGFYLVPVPKLVVVGGLADVGAEDHADLCGVPHRS